MTTICTYLSKRDATYYFRRPVPDDVQAAIGSSVWMYSLRTKDREVGKRRVHKEAVRTNELIHAARNPPAATFDNLDAPTTDYLVERYRVGLLQADDAERFGASVSPGKLAQRKEWHQANEDGWQPIREDHDAASAVQTLGAEALELTTAAGLKVDAGSMGYRRLCSQLVSVHTEVAEEVVARDWGRGSVTLSMPVRVASEPVPPPIAVPVAGLMTLFEGYVAERKPSPSTLRNWRPYVRSLIAYLGHDDASRLKQRHAHRVPLSQQSLAILREAHALSGTGRYIFPKLGSPQKPMCENTINEALRRLFYGRDEMTTHGFRSTASFLLNESGEWSIDAIERAVNRLSAH